jgi:hypothetical protein
MVFAGRRHLVMTARRYAGHAATVVVTGRDCHVYVDGRLVRRLTIDPTRRVQSVGLRQQRQPNREG